MLGKKALLGSTPSVCRGRPFGAWRRIQRRLSSTHGFQLSRRSQNIEDAYIRIEPNRQVIHNASHNDKRTRTHWSPVPSKHNTNVRAACSGGTTMGVGPLEIEPSFTPPGLMNADAVGELAVSVAVSEKLLPERKWPSSAVVDILSVSLCGRRRAGDGGR